MELEHYVCLFDESYNNIVKKGQMDMHIWYLDTSLNTVKTRYYNSQVMGKAAAKNVLKTFKECVNGMDQDKVTSSVSGWHKCEYIIFNFFEWGENGSGTKSPCFTWFLRASYNT